MEVLGSSEEKFRAIYNNAPFGIFQSTIEGRFISVNPTAVSLFGYDSQEEFISVITDIPKQIFAHPERRGDIICEALKTEKFLRREVEYRRRDGSIFVANLYMRVVRDEKDNAAYLEGFVEDITDRKRAQEMLHESERKYRELVENANSIILRWGRDGKISFMNEFGQKFFGYPENEILGRHVVGTIVSEKESTGKDLVAMMDQICANPKAFEQNVNENMRRNGERVWISWANKPVLDDDGNLLEVFSVGTDITARREVEHELEKYREHLEDLVEARTEELQKSRAALVRLVGDLNEKTAELEAANLKLKEVDRLKSMFIASMSHELRTPLNSVIGYSSIILNEWLGPVSQQQKEKLAIVLRAGKHLLSLISDVIDVSKIEAGQIDVYFEEFDLFDLIAEAAQQLEQEIRGKGLIFHVENAHLRLKTDRRRLLQALLNILSNAMKYTVEGSVRLSAISRDGWAEVAVSDTGIGISDEDAADIFKPFVRLESTVRSAVPGTGLGLYLTHKLVTEILHGTISFTSRIGEGSTFIIRMPALSPTTQRSATP